MKKEIVYVDMDDTLCDWRGAYDKALQLYPEQKYPQSSMDFFRKLKPLPGAIEGFLKLEEKGYDVWILTRPSYQNPFCYTEKRLWVEDHLGLEWTKKLILCPDKSLVKGDYLIDDYPWPGFEGKQILFGSEEFPTWKKVHLELFKDRLLKCSNLKENEK
jgi:5'-nucleotidase